MKKRNFQKWFAFLFALIFLISAFPLSSSAAGTSMYEDIDKTDVIKDLERFGIDITEYQKDVGAEHCRMLNFLEYGFDYSKSTKDYGLYIYLWNPSGKMILENGKNYIQMQTKLTDNTVSSGWKKHKLELCSYSTVQGYEHVFYKFKVSDVTSFPDSLSRDFRHYDISGIEVQFQENQNASDFLVGGVYSFMGFMPYHDAGRTPKNSLMQYVKDRVTLEIKLNPVTWKTKTSDKGAGYQYEVFSVYFAVPNDIIEDYGDKNDETKGLVKIDGSFDEQKVNGLITPYTEVYNLVKPDLGKSPSSDLSWGFACSDTDFSSNLSGGFHFNCSLLNGTYYGHFPELKKLCTVLSYNYGDFEGISEDNFRDELFAIMNDRGGVLPVLPQVDAGHVRGVQSYTVTSGNDLAKEISTYASNHDAFISWLKGEGNLYIKDESYSNIQSIQAVSNADLMINGLFKTDEAIAEEYYMQEEDVSSFKDFVSQSAQKDMTTYIMRFAVRDYYADRVHFREDGLGGNYHSSEGIYYFEKTVFMDFDVLSFTWENQYSQKTVIPVVCSPVHNVGSVTPPREPSIGGAIIDKVDEGVDNIKTFFKNLAKFKPLIGLVVGLFIFAVVTWILSKFGISLSDIFRALGKIITAPFRLIGLAFKRKDENSEESRKRAEESRKQAAADREAEAHEWKREDRSKKK